MKIWLNEQYAIEQTDGNNLFGKGNDNFDFIEVYIPTAVYEQDNVIPVFIFERSDKKKYGEFAHNVGTWQQDGYTVFKHVLNGFVLAHKGNLDITIKLNFLKYVDEKRFIEKTKNLYVQGVVLNAIVVENEAFILSDEPEAFLTSLKYLLNDLNARIESGDITAERALADGNGNVITDTYATKAESEQVLVDAKAYGDAVFETKGNVLSKVNTLKTEIQNGTVVANNAVEATSYRDNENNLVVIKDKIEDILYLINDVTGADLTGLQSKINALEVAWNNFMNGSESDDVIDTLNEIRNELASLDSASKKALYNLGENDTVVDNGNGTVTISRNNGAYNETVAKGVPLITLDSQGSKWLTDEWKKSLNLFDGVFVENYGVPLANLEVGKTYTFSTTTTGHTYKISVSAFAVDLVETYNAKITFVMTEEYKNCSIYTIQSGTTPIKSENIMLNKGSVAYDYQPYNANKHITNFEADFIKEESLKSGNLIDINNILYGYECDQDGNNIVNTNWYVIDYIKVKPNTTYTVSGISSDLVVLCDNNKNAISYVRTYTFTTPSNCYYVKFNSSIEGYSTPMLNKGSEAQPYHEFEGEIVRTKELEEQVAILNEALNTMTDAFNALAQRVGKLEGSVEFTGEQFVSGRAGTLADTTGYYPAGTNSFTIDGNVKSVSITYSDRNDVSYSGNTITYTLRGEIAGKITNATITYKYTASTSTASVEEVL